MFDLRLGDCLEVMKEIEDNSIDLILCDLPYGTTSCSWDIVIPFDLMWSKILRVCKKNACILLFGSEPFSSMLRCSNLPMYKYDLYWKKEKPTNFMQLKRRFGKVTENICVFYQDQPTFNPQMIRHNGKPVKNSPNAMHNSIVSGINQSKITPYHDNGYRYPSDILEFRRVQLGQYLHPTQKPIELIEYLIKTFSNEGDTILDFTMGSGTTGVACINLNRNFIGIEKDPKYFEIAKDRIYKASCIQEKLESYKEEW